MERLARELTQPQYADMDDKTAANLLNTPSEPTARPVAVAEMLNGAYQTGLYARLLAASKRELPDDVYGELTALLHLVNSPIQTIDMTSVAAQRMVATLTGAGLVTAQEVEMLRALAVVPGHSRAQELGLAAVTADDVAAAREWLAAEAAEAERRVVYAAMRERLVTGYHAGLAWLAAEEQAGHDAPEWSDVVERL